MLLRVQVCLCSLHDSSHSILDSIMIWKQFSLVNKSNLILRTSYSLRTYRVFTGLKNKDDPINSTLSTAHDNNNPKGNPQASLKPFDKVINVHQLGFSKSASKIDKVLHQLKRVASKNVLIAIVLKIPM